jgi:hypothetical protein
MDANARTLSEVTRRSGFRRPTALMRRVTPDRVLAFERSRCRDASFACVKGQVYAQDVTALHCSARTG